MIERGTSYQLFRYADDTAVHCRTEQEARQLLADIDARLKDANWNYILQKQRLYIAKIRTDRKNILILSLIFLGIPFEKCVQKTEQADCK